MLCIRHNTPRVSHTHDTGKSFREPDCSVSSTDLAFIDYWSAVLRPHNWIVEEAISAYAGGRMIKPRPEGRHMERPMQSIKEPLSNRRLSRRCGASIFGQPLPGNVLRDWMEHGLGVLLSTECLGLSPREAFQTVFSSCFFEIAQHSVCCEFSEKPIWGHAFLW